MRRIDTSLLGLIQDAPRTSLLLRGVLGLMQSHAFLSTMGQLARLGFLSINTESYALVLAYLCGSYFIASLTVLELVRS